MNIFGKYAKAISKPHIIIVVPSVLILFTGEYLTCPFDSRKN